MADIHPQLQQDCILLGRFQLSHLLLMNDASYPWFILVPDRFDITEIYQLTKIDQHQLCEESGLLSNLLMETFHGEKLNIAAIGNLVPQLHLHHVIRYKNDRAWPSPVWGRFSAVAYEDSELDRLLDRLNLSSMDGFVC
ncbi:MAG: HIT domain-containing protein [Gammaproteobacteria bacterium]|nr:HIT domain-containing protein [Gammaproteobacteria bacterium]